MRGASALLACGLLFAPAAAQVVSAPFDRMVEVQPDGLSWLVLRYVVPGLPEMGYAASVPELDRLCGLDGVAWALAEGVDHVLVVLMDRPVPRGQPDAEATQFIGAYRLEAGTCHAE